MNSPSSKPTTAKSPTVKPTAARVIVYHQQQVTADGTRVPLQPMIRSGRLTHLFLAALHLSDDGVAVLNDHPHDDPYHDQLWAEARQVQRAGVPVLVMVGGWAPGTTAKLDGADFERFYPVLRDFLRAHDLDGIDIDVEQDMSLDGVIRLIDALRADFGPGFSIVLAPVASAMWGGENLSGFDYEELYRRRGDDIDWVQVQFYSGFGSLVDTADVERIIARGVYPVDKLVLGVVGHPDDAQGYVDIDQVCATLSALVADHPTLGGVDVWEYYRALPGGQEAPWLWIDRVAQALDAGRDPVNRLALIPSPQQVHLSEGYVVLPRRPLTWGDAEDIELMADLLGPGVDLRPRPIAPGDTSATDTAGARDATGTSGTPGDTARPDLVLDRDESLDPGAYRIEVDQGVRVCAGDAAGWCHAAATLHQLLPPWTHGPAPLPGAELSLPRVTIADAPRFSWRGMHLDVARHFMPLPFLYRFVDQLAAHKLDVFHLHLTEDQGWRFEVHGYPELHRRASWRPQTCAPAWEEGDGSPHGGYYTQDQLRALVGYAARRGVTIVPEVDLPGHVRALLAAYPRFGEPSRDDHGGVATGFGVFDEVLHLSEETMQMVYDVLEQLLDVFPSTYIHVGGDECPTTQWTASEAAAQRARELGLDGPEQLQGWFTRQVQEWLGQRGRTVVAWDEVLAGDPPAGTVIMSWRGTGTDDPAAEAVRRGLDAVMAPGHSTYFDHYQDDGDREPYAIGGHTPWTKVLGFDPGALIPDDAPGRLLGVQAQLWTEYVPTAQHAEYMLFPRLAVLAEIAWATTPADAQAMAARLARHGRRLDAAGLNHRPVGGAHPWQQGGTGARRRPDEHRTETPR